jgi:hypothetical protein
MVMKNRSTKPPVGRQAPGSLWSPHDALVAVESGTVEEDVAILKRAGILGEDGKVSARYKRWGKNESRTQSAEPSTS